MEENIITPSTAVAVPEEKTVVLAGNPEKQMEYAVKSSKMLVQILSQKPNKVVFNKEQYLEFEDWQTLGRFYGATVATESTKMLEREGKFFGYEAKAVVYINGQIVSSAEGMCCRDEKNWGYRAKYDWVNGRKQQVGEEAVPEFQLRSMAQTRASSKALRNVLAWVAVLGGFKPTPAEEMDGLAEKIPNQSTPTNGTKIPDARTKAQAVLDKDASTTKAGIAYRSPDEEKEIAEANAIMDMEAGGDIQMEAPPETTYVADKNPWDVDETPKSHGCFYAGCTKPITDKVRKYSLDKFGKVYCYDHQPKPTTHQ